MVLTSSLKEKRAAIIPMHQIPQHQHPNPKAQTPTSETKHITNNAAYISLSSNIKIVKEPTAK